MTVLLSLITEEEHKGGLLDGGLWGIVTEKKKRLCVFDAWEKYRTSVFQDWYFFPMVMGGQEQRKGSAWDRDRGK